MSGKKLTKRFTAISLIIAAIQLVGASCSDSGMKGYSPPISGTFFTTPDEAWALTRDGVLKRISTLGPSTRVEDAQERVQGVSFTNPFQSWTVDREWNIWHSDGVDRTLVGQNPDNGFSLVWPSSLIFCDETVGWARTLVSLFITEDGGRTWKKVLVTGPGEYSRLFVVDKDTAFLYGEKSSIRRTSDRGKTWTDIDLGVTGNVNSLVCQNRGGDECWAGTATGELFSISKIGVSRLPLPEKFGEFSIFSIAFDETNGNLLVSGFIHHEGPHIEDSDGFLLRSGDGGQTWVKMDVPQVNRFVHVASFGNAIWLASYTAIYRSSDSGGSWTKVFDAER